jgi:hypothetical protein
MYILQSSKKYTLGKMTEHMTLAEKNRIYTQRYRAKLREELGDEKYKEKITADMQKYRTERHKRERHIQSEPVRENPICKYVKPVVEIKKKTELKDNQKNLEQDGIIKKGMIYIIEHNSNPELKYVGQTKDSLSKRWNGHLATFKLFDKMFYRLGFFVNYYGVENFSIREYKIYKNITQDFLDDEEKKYIFEFGTLNTQYCNEDITIKMTNELQNEFIKMLIDKEVNMTCIQKVIDTFEHNYKGERLEFTLDDENRVVLESRSIAI